MTKKTKKEIVKTITKAFADETGNEKGKGQLTQELTKKIVQMTFNSIVEVLVEEGRIELRKFGVFQVKRRAPRKARNPRTGEKVDVSEKFVVTFKPGKEMVERVNEISDEIYEEWENGRKKDGGKASQASNDSDSLNGTESTSSNSESPQNAATDPPKIE